MAVDPTRLDAVPLFRSVIGEDRIRLAAAITVKEAPVGTVLTREDDLPMQVFAIEEGRVAVAASNGFGTFLGPGDVFGEIATLTRTKRTANIVAVTDCRLLALTGWDFRDLTTEIPTLAEAVVATVERRVAELEG